MNCKPGDLAFIVSSDNPANLGAVVTVLYIDSLQSLIDAQPSWRVSACSMLQRADGKITFDGCVEDSRLRPISGVPLTDDVTNEEKVSA